MKNENNYQFIRKAIFIVLFILNIAIAIFLLFVSLKVIYMFSDSTIYNDRVTYLISLLDEDPYPEASFAGFERNVKYESNVSEEKLSKEIRKHIGEPYIDKLGHSVITINEDYTVTLQTGATEEIISNVAIFGDSKDGLIVYGTTLEGYDRKYFWNCKEREWRERDPKLLNLWGTEYKDNENLLNYPFGTIVVKDTELITFLNGEISNKLNLESNIKAYGKSYILSENGDFYYMQINSNGKINLILVDTNVADVYKDVYIQHKNYAIDIPVYKRDNGETCAGIPKGYPDKMEEDTIGEEVKIFKITENMLVGNGFRRNNGEYFLYTLEGTEYELKLYLTIEISDRITNLLNPMELY